MGAMTRDPGRHLLPLKRRLPCSPAKQSALVRSMTWAVFPSLDRCTPPQLRIRVGLPSLMGSPRVIFHRRIKPFRPRGMAGPGGGYGSAMRWHAAERQHSPV